jgi:hypothetical protein
MLALHRSRCTLHSPPLLSIRTLRTVPRRIPTYIKKWDPTLHESTRQDKVTIKPPTQAIKTQPHDTEQVANRSNLRKKTRIRLRDGDFSLKSLNILWRLKDELRLATTRGRMETSSKRLALWRAYRLAKFADEPITPILSDCHWGILWTSQAFRSSDNPKRTLHLEELYDDMVSVGRTPTAIQRAEYLECLFLNGKEHEAVKGWEADHIRIGNLEAHSYVPEHLEVGARIYALAGHADRSRQIMNTLFELYPDWNPSVMLSVLRTHTSCDLTRYHNHAKDIYDKMRQNTSKKMAFRDYDACFVGFLEARHLYYAKAVFQDMVKDGFMATSGSPEEVEKVLKRLHMLYRLGKDVSTMTTIAIAAIDVLPTGYHTHLFGDWMKMTVVKQMPEATAQILDKMIKRGYTPQTFHFNMLLTALIRTKESPNVLKAENIGWRMIDETRKAYQRTTRSSHAKQSSNSGAAPNLPAADATTFALLMQHHAQRLQWEYVDYLSRQLNETSVVPNATIMNVLIDNKTRQGAYVEALAIYKQLTRPSKRGESTGVFPDGASIRLLWKTLRFALGNEETRRDPKLPTPRDLLKETLAWWSRCNRRYDADRFRTGLAGDSGKAISSLILHCFSYTLDIAGTLVALRALRHHFTIFPSENDVEILHRQIAWVDMSRESSAVGTQYFANFSSQHNIVRVKQVYKHLVKRRVQKEFKSRGGVDLNVEEVGDFNLNALSELARVAMKRQYPPDIVEQMIEATKRDVGYEGGTGDVDAHQAW